MIIDWRYYFPMEEVLFDDRSYPFPDRAGDSQISQLQVFINAAALSRLAYAEDPVAAFNEERDTSGTTFLFVKVIQPQVTTEGAIRQQMVIGLAKSRAEAVPVVYVAFRGIDGAQDLVSDVAVAGANDPLGADVRDGFRGRLSSVPRDILRHLLFNCRYPCVFTGHSFGGAVANVVALDLLLNFCGNYGNVWENEELVTTDEPVTSENHIRLSVITFGAPSIATKKLMPKLRDEKRDFRKLFHFVVRPDDPVLAVLNLLPFLKDKASDEFQGMVNSLVPVLPSLMLGEHEAEPTTNLLVDILAKFALIPPKERTGFQAPVAFGCMYVIEQGKVLRPADDELFFQSLKDHWTNPETFFARLSETSLGNHAVTSYVDVFTKMASSTIVTDHDNCDELEADFNKVAYPKPTSKAKGFVRENILEVRISFHSSVPKELFGSVVATTDYRYSRFNTDTYPISQIKHTRNLAKGDSRQLKSSLILTMNLANQEVLESLEQFELRTVFGDVVIAKFELHYLGFLGDFHELTSVVLKKELIRMFLSLQSDLAKQAAASTTDSLSANFTEQAKLLDQLIGNSRMDLFLSVAKDASTTVKEQFGFTEPAGRSSSNHPFSVGSGNSAFDEFMRTVNLGELFENWQFLRRTWQVTHPDWEIGLRAHPANVNELYRPFPSLDEPVPGRRDDKMLRFGVRALAKQFAEKLHETARSSLDGQASDSMRKREEESAMLYRNFIVPNLIILEALIMSNLNGEDLLNSSCDLNNIAANWQTAMAATAATTGIWVGVDALIIAATDSITFEVIVTSILRGTLGVVGGAAIGGGLAMTAYLGYKAWKSYIRPMVLQWRHNTLAFDVAKMNLASYGAVAFPFKRTGKAFHDDNYTAKLKSLFAMARVDDPSDTAIAEIQVWTWLKNTPKMRFLLKPEDIDALPVDSPVRAIITSAKATFSTGASRKAFLHWAQMVAMIGAIRSRHDRSFTIGVVGLARLGKSTLITRLFPDLPTQGGGRDRDRTTTPRYLRAKAGLHVIDFPGANETSDNVRACVTQTIPLLNAIIIVCQAERVDSKEQKEFILGEVKNFLQSHADVGTPFLVCLNSADVLVAECRYNSEALHQELRTKSNQVLEWLKEVVTDIDKWKIRKEVHVDKGGVDRTYIKQEYVKVEDLIRPTCFVTRRHDTIKTKRKQTQMAFLQEQKKEIMEELRHTDDGVLLPLEQRGVWFEEDVAEWLKDKIPLANVDALRDRFEDWELPSDN